MAILRSLINPIIQPSNVTASNDKMEVIGVFNAGVAKYRDEVILLLRVAERPINDDPSVYLTPVYDPDSDQIHILRIQKHNDNDISDIRVLKTPYGNYLTSISHMRVARSKDGIHFTIEKTPSIAPGTMYESFGVEDPRITQIGDMYYITYSAVSKYGIVTALISTKDFLVFHREGNLFHPDNKDVVILPRAIGGKYYALHRPSCSHYGKPEMWIAESNDLLLWGNHRHLIGVRQGFWDEGRIGASAVPFEIDEGWLEIYHGADHENRYCLGALLLDKEEPWKVLARSETPLMFPEHTYEVEGFFGNVIFSCGALYEEGKIKIYYGACDTCIGYGETTIDYVMGNMVQSKQVWGVKA